MNCIYKLLTIKLLAISTLLVSCKPDEPRPKYQYERNPHYKWGYAEYYGPWYAEYNNNSNVLSLSFFSDSLDVNNDGELSGTGQYLYIEDVFIPADSIILPEGKYVSSESGLPFTFHPGRQFEVDELKIDVGAFLFYKEKNKNYSVMKQVSRGEFTVKIADSKHIITCDFVLSDSTKITGTFTDTIPHFDFSAKPKNAPRQKIKLTL